MEKIELLAPAKDADCGFAAVNAGADAVYIGAARFGARSKAGNPLSEIEKLILYAHKYWIKIYLTLNTILHDEEIPLVLKLAKQAYEIGVDGLIIQDVGLMECELPPIPLIASTQMHNTTVEKVQFLEKVGFQRVILARELNLDQIRKIRQNTKIDLEFFIHGALCVCFSGQCYLSYAIGGRSGNRGECAQPCRKIYSLLDKKDQVLIKDKYLLSLKDLNLSDHLEDLIDAGVTSFKIEGRLKEADYVRNVVHFYRLKIDKILKRKNLVKSSSGKVLSDIVPDVNKTFNRGYTTCFLNGRKESPGSIDTPKMKGEFIGKVLSIDKRFFMIGTSVELHNGDGISFFDDLNQLHGTVINQILGQRIEPQSMTGIKTGTDIFRNHDHLFLRQMNQKKIERKIEVKFTFSEIQNGFRLAAYDEDQNEAAEEISSEKIKADNPLKSKETILKQLSKSGDTEFSITEIEIRFDQVFFFSISFLNEIRRKVLKKLLEVREVKRPWHQFKWVPNNCFFPARSLDFRGNVLNQKAVEFYKRHGVIEISPAAESGLNLKDQQVMTTKYCIKYELGMCRRFQNHGDVAEPLYLTDEDGRRYRLNFDCQECVMHVVF